MLNNQTFVPTPLLGIGPELFFDPHGVCGIDFKTVELYRKVWAYAPFKFVYLSVANSRHGDSFMHCNMLKKMGVILSMSTVCDLSRPAQVMAAKKLARTLDVIYAPEFSDKVYCPGVPSLASVPKEVMIQALHEQAQPQNFDYYSPLGLYNLAIQIWQTKR